MAARGITNTITNSHGPTPFRTREGEARLGSGLPNPFRPFQKHGSPAGSALGLHPPHEGAAEFTVSIGGDPIATGSFPARRNGMADDPQDQTVVVLAQSARHLLASLPFIARAAPHQGLHQ